MDKLKTHFKKYSIYYYALLVIFMIAATIVMPVLINRAYRIPKGISYSDNFESQIGDKTYSGKARNIMWSTDTSLLYFGSVLTFVGTVFLGLVALYQNKKNNEFLNNQLKGGISIFEALDKSSDGSPKIYLIDDEGFIDLQFINKGPQHVLCNDCNSLDNKVDIVICVGETFSIKFDTDDIVLEDKSIGIATRLRMMNLYGIKYSQLFYFHAKKNISSNRGWVTIENDCSTMDIDG